VVNHAKKEATETAKHEHLNRPYRYLLRGSVFFWKKSF